LKVVSGLKTSFRELNGKIRNHLSSTGQGKIVAELGTFCE